MSGWGGKKQGRQPDAHAFWVNSVPARHGPVRATSPPPRPAGLRAWIGKIDRMKEIGIEIVM